MLSYNASTYEAVASKLEKLINSDRMGESLCTLGVQWKFIPKRAPGMGALGSSDRPHKTSTKEGIGKGICHFCYLTNTHCGDRSCSQW